MALGRCLLFVYLLGPSRQYFPLFSLLPGLSVWHCGLGKGLVQAASGLMNGYEIPESSYVKVFERRLCHKGCRY